MWELFPVTPLSYRAWAFFLLTLRWGGVAAWLYNCSADCGHVRVREKSENGKAWMCACVCVSSLLNNKSSVCVCIGWRSGSSAAVVSITRQTGGSQSSECVGSGVWESVSKPEDSSHEAVSFSFLFFSQPSKRFDTLDTTLLVSARDRPFLPQNPCHCASSVCRDAVIVALNRLVMIIY